MIEVLDAIARLYYIDDYHGYKIEGARLLMVWCIMMTTTRMLMTTMTMILWSAAGNKM